MSNAFLPIDKKASLTQKTTKAYNKLLFIFLTLCSMNRMESQSQETTPQTPSTLSSTMRKIGLAVLTILAAAGCNGKVTDGFGVISETGKCLQAKIKDTLADKCATEEGKSELATFVLGGNCERIPDAETPLSFAGNKGTARDFVQKGVDNLCRQD